MNGTSMKMVNDLDSGANENLKRNSDIEDNAKIDEDVSVNCTNGNKLSNDGHKKKILKLKNKVRFADQPNEIEKDYLIENKDVLGSDVEMDNMEKELDKNVSIAPSKISRKSNRLSLKYDSNHNNANLDDSREFNVNSVINNIMDSSKIVNNALKNKKDVDEINLSDDGDISSSVSKIDNVVDSTVVKSSHKKLSLLSSSRKQSRPMKIASDDMSNILKKLPPDVEALINDVEKDSLSVTRSNSSRNGKLSKINNEIKDVESSIMQNLAACGTQISFSNRKTSKDSKTCDQSKNASNKPNVSIFLENGDEMEELPQDLTVNKKRTSPINLQIPERKMQLKDTLSKLVPVSSQNHGILKPKNSALSPSSLFSDAFKFSSSLDSQLVESNTIIETPSFFSPFIVEEPPKYNLADIVQQLKKTIDENPLIDESNGPENEEDVTEKIVSEISRETAQEPYKEYFSSALGKFFLDIGFNLVQEHVQKDLIQSQKARLRHNKQSKILPEDFATLEKGYQAIKKRNSIYKCTMKKCDFCDFKSESELVIRKHLASPHLNKQVYSCNFCPFQTQTRNLTEYYQHMVMAHGISPTHEKNLSIDCVNCEYSCKNKKSLEKHLLYCVTQFKEETNLAPEAFWEPPVKITKHLSQPSLLNTKTFVENSNNSFLVKNKSQIISIGENNILKPSSTQQRLTNTPFINQDVTIQPANRGVVSAKMAAVDVKPSKSRKKGNSKYDDVLKAQMTILMQKLYSESCPKKIKDIMQRLQMFEALTQSPQTTSNSSKTSQDVVQCEICDGFVNSKAELRIHVMTMHHIKIHPRMLNQKPNLNCEKCEQRFYTDQGLERHLLGKHGLVSNMLQTAACSGQDAGRCPMCGKYLTGGLLLHVSTVHNTVLRPAFLSYKCTVCAATFPAYALFETHVYTEHKTVLPTS